MQFNFLLKPMLIQSDAELVKRIFPEPWNVAIDISVAWREFITGCQNSITTAFQQVSALHNYEPSSDDIYQILEKTLVFLYQQDYKKIRANVRSDDFRLESLIAPLALPFILEFFNNRNANRQQNESKVLSDLPTNESNKS
jgi:hypothetical protein